MPFFQKLFRDFAVYGVADAILKAVGIITLPIYTRIFPPDEFGLWATVLAATGILAGVLSLGGDSAYARYFFEAKTMEARREITSTWLAFLAAWSLGVTVLCLPLAPPFSEFLLESRGRSSLLVLAMLALPLNLINAMCSQALRNQFRAGLFALLNVITTLLTVGLGLLAVFVLELGILGLFAGALAAVVLMLPVRLYTIRELLGPRFSARALRDLLSYGVPLVPMSLAYWVFASSDRLMLAKLSTMEQVGLYTVASSITSILAFFTSALGQAWSPHAVQVYEHDRQRAPAVYGQVMTYLLVGFGILAVAITVFAPEMLLLLTTPAFFGAAAAVGPLALGYVAYASTQITAGGISLTKRTGYFALYAWAAALMNLGLNYWFIPHWGMLGAAIATMITYAFLTGAYLLTSQRLWAVAYEKRRAAGAALLTLAFTFAAGFLPRPTSTGGLVIKALFCAGFVGALFLFKVFDRREFGMLRGRLGLLVRPAGS